MWKWILVVILALGAHFSASYLVPLMVLFLDLTKVLPIAADLVIIAAVLTRR